MGRSRLVADRTRGRPRLHRRQLSDRRSTWNATPAGDIQLRGSAQIYVPLYLKTFRMALIITLLCIVLGYPLSFYLSNAPPRRPTC